MFLFGGCFTGIESTKKIKLTREVKKSKKTSDEELFFNGIIGQTVGTLNEGHRFYVTDDRAILIFEPEGIPLGVSMPEIGGDTITFTGVEPRVDASGEIKLVLDFTDGSFKLPYNTGRPFDTGLDSFRTDQIPMIIDLDIVAQAKELLQGKKVWTKTLLWYDKNGERINGRKFVPVTITDVEPGNMVFPLNVKILSNDSTVAWMWMNTGHSGTESRSFFHLFSLTDPHEKHPGITNEIWEKITNGDVTVGMTKDECRLALGLPSDLSSGHDYSQTLDMWSYENGIILWFEDGVLTRFRK